MSLCGSRRYESSVAGCEEDASAIGYIHISVFSSRLADRYHEIYQDRDFIVTLGDVTGGIIADAKLLQQVFSNMLCNA